MDNIVVILLIIYVAIMEIALAVFRMRTNKRIKKLQETADQIEAEINQIDKI